MKLRSLGQAYSTSDNQVETVASEDTTRFLEQNSTLCHPTQTTPVAIPNIASTILCQSAQEQDQEDKPKPKGPDGEDGPGG